MDSGAERIQKRRRALLIAVVLGSPLAVTLAVWLLHHNSDRADREVGRGRSVAEEEQPQWLEDATSPKPAAGEAGKRLGMLRTTGGLQPGQEAPAAAAEPESDDWLLRDEDRRAGQATAGRQRGVYGADAVSILDVLMGAQVAGHAGSGHGALGLGDPGTTGNHGEKTNRIARVKKAKLRWTDGESRHAPPPAPRPATALGALLGDKQAGLAQFAAEPDTKKERAAVPTHGKRRVRGPVPLPNLGDHSIARDQAAPAAGNATGRLLARYASLDGVRYREARGYWQNTYIPGDPALRALQAEMQARAPGALARMSLTGDPAAAAQRHHQPFDVPEQAALGLYLNASERGVTDPTRMLVQVGIKATDRLGGHRPAMKLALVVDLTSTPDASTAAILRATLEAFAAARDLGDRFSLIVAGRPGGLVLRPDDFRHGPLRVALSRLLSDSPHPVGRGETTLDLGAALEAAADQVRSADAPNAPLGSSAVVLMKPSRMDAAVLEDLAQRAHGHAVSGVPVSAFGFGPGVDTTQLDRIALAGQGSRRAITRAADATAAVQRELSSVARVVARAMRLRIRLAPGVKLVDVLGSRRLDLPEADRVREAEQSIDRRMARNLGITADRGDDEEGIQIVVPTFYAGDHHVILLDVVVPGPGAVADVSVRYKDLVHLENGVARTHLALGNRKIARGALELGVLKNLLAFELSRHLGRAADGLAKGQQVAAMHDLVQARELLQSAALPLPALARDADLRRDRALIDQYRAVITAHANGIDRAFISASLRLAAAYKLQPRTPWIHDTPMATPGLH